MAGTGTTSPRDALTDVFYGLEFDGVNTAAALEVVAACVPSRAT